MPHTARFTGDYGEDWHTLSAAARATTGHRCARCHHPFRNDGAPRPCDALCDRTRGRTTDLGGTGARKHAWDRPGLNFGVHHLDGNKANDAWWNLLPLCNSCHLTIQARVIPERPYLFAHSEWFRPYVAGFYAYYHGWKLQITRDAAEQHMDFWLSLGQPWLYQDALPTPPDWWAAYLAAMFSEPAAAPVATTED